ncbi:hypothetical protein EXIGLDRAFT_672148 [Exidia glandulosa HHB12029]|uniref:Uncharacterized protein n=1 Tax=Exidia glandulosa HHB12029 TaxID=1314781 RepID=A0A165JX27_EXIGL|nr:hypothetical protein EXIGLDRAFT_672148 [Exidia glandulosa HHB12029]
MSASDAKESIGRVGGLKERMAALQGKGGFGAPAPVSPPVPSAPKPAWKRPVVPVEETAEDGAPDVKPAADADEQPEEHPAETEVDADGEPVEKSEEELERERRAALAAKMARLGGTRVGMAPVFGRAPPPAVKPKPKQLSTGSTSDSAPAQPTSPPAAPVVTAEPPSHIDLPERTLSPSAVPLPTGGDTPGVVSPPAALVVEAPVPSKSPAPASMPMPAAPRRALPPRKKTPKKEEAPPVLPDEPLPAPPTTEVGAVVAAVHDTAAEKDDAEPLLSKDLDAPAAPDASATSLLHEPVEEKNVSEQEVAAETKPEPTRSIESNDEHAPVPAPVDEPESVAEIMSELEPQFVDKESDPLPPQDQPHPEHEHEYKDEEIPAVTEEKEYMEDVVPPSAFDEQPEQPEQQEHKVEFIAVLEEKEDKEKFLLPSEEPFAPSVTPLDPPAHTTEEEDEEEARRARIAEKMAKMGGRSPFGFSAPAPAPARRASEEEEADDDDEEARRARIAEKIAKMGGRNAFGAPPPPPPVRRPSETKEEEVAQG